MELTVTPGLKKREPNAPLLPTPSPPTGRDASPFVEPHITASAGAESALMLKGIGPDHLRLPYERLPNGNYGPDKAITRLLTCLSSIYEAHPESREALRAAGFVYAHGEEQLAESQHDPEDREEDHQEDRDEEGREVARHEAPL